MYQPHHQSLQMHIMNNTRFYEGTRDILGKKSETNRGRAAIPHPLNPPMESSKARHNYRATRADINLTHV